MDRNPSDRRNMPALRRSIFLISGLVLIGIGLFLSLPLSHSKGVVLGGLPFVFGLFSLKEAFFPYKKKK